METIQVTDWGEQIEYCCTLYDAKGNVEVRSRRMLYWEWLESECDRINQDPERKAIISSRINPKTGNTQKALFANIPTGYIDLEMQRGFAYRYGEKKNDRTN